MRFALWGVARMTAVTLWTEVTGVLCVGCDGDAQATRVVILNKRSVRKKYKSG